MATSPKKSSLFKRSIQSMLRPSVNWLANRVSSAPKRTDVFSSLTELYKEIIEHHQEKKGTLFQLDENRQRIIIFSDQHKGARNGADDFSNCEAAYLAALKYYDSEQFFFVNLGDAEELWENNIFSVIKHNEATFIAEKRFVDRYAYCKVYGNHDSFWRFDPLAPGYIKQIYKTEVAIQGGIVLRYTNPDGTNLDIFCTHGHQGDKRSDGGWFSAAFVNYIWGPLQSFLEINTNTPSDNPALKTLHNTLMYEWSSQQKNLLLITGHTHQPVFNSLTHLERLLLRRQAAQDAHDNILVDTLNREIPRRLQEYPHESFAAMKVLPSYFNSGCCCYTNGVITGIEIDKGFIRLVKWGPCNELSCERIVLEEISIEEVLKQLAVRNV